MKHTHKPPKKTNKQTPTTLLLESNNQALLVSREHWKILFPLKPQRLCLYIFKTNPSPLILIIEEIREREIELHKNWPVGGSRAWEGRAGMLQEVSPKLSEFEWLTTPCLQFYTLRSGNYLEHRHEKGRYIAGQGCQACRCRLPAETLSLTQQGLCACIWDSALSSALALTNSVTLRKSFHQGGPSLAQSKKKKTKPTVLHEAKRIKSSMRIFPEENEMW